LVRQAVEKLCASSGFATRACDDVGLCVNEALANVIRHAYAGATDKPIDISAQVKGDSLHVTIRDWGSGVRPPRESPVANDPFTPGGIGLICLNQMMDQVIFTPQPDGMLLELIKNKKQPMADIPTNSQLVPAARVEGDTIFATVRGEVDLHSSPELRGALLGALNQHNPKKVILNLAEVPYMDSSAVAVLVEALQKLRKSGGKICLTNLQPRVRGLLEIARLDSIFVLAADEEEAKKK
jgi:anti-sigma B factor antagonist